VKDAERRDTALKQVEGKRLMFKSPSKKDLQQQCCGTHGTPLRN
jgi:hypothetical protein